MRDMFEVLGEKVVQEMADSVGFDWGGLVKGAAGVAQTGINQYESDDAKAKASKDQSAALNKSINADQEWANAAANLWLAQQTGDATSTSAASALHDSKKSDAQAAGALLTPDSMTKRCQTAKDALKAATTAANAAGKDIARQSKMHGWQEVVDHCGTAPDDDTDTGGGKGKKKKDKGEEGGGSWITAKHAGLPTYGWIGIGVGGVAVLALVVRLLRRK